MKTRYSWRMRHTCEDNQGGKKQNPQLIPEKTDSSLLQSKTLSDDNEKRVVKINKEQKNSNI